MTALGRSLDKQSAYDELDAHEASCFPDAVLCQPSQCNCCHRTADAAQSTKFPAGVRLFIPGAVFDTVCTLLVDAKAARKQVTSEVNAVVSLDS